MEGIFYVFFLSFSSFCFLFVQFLVLIYKLNIWIAIVFFQLNQLSPCALIVASLSLCDLSRSDGIRPSGRAEHYSNGSADRSLQIKHGWRVQINAANSDPERYNTFARLHPSRSALCRRVVSIKTSFHQKKINSEIYYSMNIHQKK
jgi:hypothetical protein